MDRFVREAECREITGLGRTTRWEMERAGKFPPRRRLSHNTVGWLASELKRWMRSRGVGMSVAPVRAIAVQVRFRDKPPARTRARKARLRSRSHQAE